MPFPLLPLATLVTLAFIQQKPSTLVVLCTPALLHSLCGTRHSPSPSTLPLLPANALPWPALLGLKIHLPCTGPTRTTVQQTDRPTTDDTHSAPTAHTHIHTPVKLALSSSASSQQSSARPLSTLTLTHHSPARLPVLCHICRAQLGQPPTSLKTSAVVVSTTDSLPLAAFTIPPLFTTLYHYHPLPPTTD